MLIKTFTVFNEAIAASKRVGIEHINELKPLEFISLCNYFKDELKGVLSSEKVKINLKIDGCGVRFGIDEGKFYLESSHSGPVYKIGAFSEFTKNKTGVSDPVSKSYDDVLKTLKMNGKLQSYLKARPGIKIHAELLYTPLAKEIEDTLQFLVIKYPKNVLGSKFTLVLYKIEGADNEQQIFLDLKRMSDSEVVFEDQRLKFDNIDITYEIDSFLDVIKDVKDIEYFMTSRKHVDRPTKQAIVDMVKEYQNKLSKKIMSTKFDHSFLGADSMEGLVLYFSNGKVVKVVSSEYKEGKQQFNAGYKK